MTFDELLINRRSVGKFKDTSVSNEVITLVRLVISLIQAGKS